MQRNRASESPKPLKVRVQGVAPKVTVKMVAVEEDTSMQLFSMREREREQTGTECQQRDHLRQQA